MPDPILADVTLHCSIDHGDYVVRAYDVVAKPWVPCPRATSANPHKLKLGELAQAG